MSVSDKVTVFVFLLRAFACYWRSCDFDAQDRISLLVQNLHQISKLERVVPPFREEMTRLLKLRCTLNFDATSYPMLLMWCVEIKDWVILFKPNLKSFLGSKSRYNHALIALPFNWCVW